MPFPHTLATFRARFPEFVATDDAQVQACLDEAAREIDEDVFDDRAGDAHANLTGHLLTSSAFGRDARLSKTSEETTYSKRYDRLVRICGGAHRLVLP